jgi:hypothetical protein
MRRSCLIKQLSKGGGDLRRRERNNYKKAVRDAARLLLFRCAAADVDHGISGCSALVR